MALVGAQYGESMEVVLFQSNQPQADVYKSYVNNFQNLLASLRFGPARAGIAGVPGSPNAPADPQPGYPTGTGYSRPPAPAFGQGGVTGIYRAAANGATDSVASLWIDDPARKTPNYMFLVFFPDGRVRKGLPTQGLDTVVVESSMRLDIASGGKLSSRWGICQMSGDSGRIIFADSSGGQQFVSGLRGEVWGIMKDAGNPSNLVINGTSYVRMEGGNGLRLEGTYKPFGDTRQPGITFTPDGEFADEGIFQTNTSMAVGVVGGGIGAVYDINSPGPGRGTYRISNYGMQLNYSNSRRPTRCSMLNPRR